MFSVGLRSLIGWSAIGTASPQLSGHVETMRHVCTFPESILYRLHSNLILPQLYKYHVTQESFTPLCCFHIPTLL